jgi:hypothetical protein
MDNSGSRLARLLFSNGPASDRADKMGLYGWLIGDWTMDPVMHAPNGEIHERRGEIGFTWVLEGRAIQDVWILPDFFYGTTLRVYDPGIDAWHILWSDPLRQFYSQQIAGRTDRTSSSWASPTTARTRAGALPISPRTRFARWVNSRPTAERPGACEPNSSADAKPENSTKSRRSQCSIMFPSASAILRAPSASMTQRFARWVMSASAKMPMRSDMGETKSVSGSAQPRGRYHPTRHQTSTSPLPRPHVRPSMRSMSLPLSTGGADNGAPGLRPDYGTDYYAAFVVDTDGYRIEAYCGG